MQRFTMSRRTLGSFATLLFLLAATLSSLVLINRASAAPSKAYVSLDGSFANAPAGAHLSGPHADTAPLTISLALQPRDGSQLDSLLTALYDPSSPQFHHWLSKGAFNASFAPLASQVGQAQNFLVNAGLTVIDSPTPFLVRATGTTAQVEAALHTQINDYRAANGQSFFQNDTAVQIPASLSGQVIAVAGLSNTAHLHPGYVLTREAAQKAGKPVPLYGAGPGGSGLTPSQTTSLYGATAVYRLGNRGKGQGATLAVFELSGYTPADITVYEHQFFGPSENVPLVDINVDGGPVTPTCPSGDICTPNDYSGDIEVEADIEMQIAIAPQIDRILVYNAPNDSFGIGVLDEYFQIANDDLADSISSSWASCERDTGLPFAQIESIAFTQMAVQGQSMFASSGDTGAFSCLRGSGFPGLNVLDPASQPFVTAVGGTSFGTFDPRSNPHPAYPTGAETVWNPLNLCSSSNLGDCDNFGASGGGVSTFWGRPSYQHGPGVISSFSQVRPYCSQPAPGQFCREVPDVSANADEFTPYAEYCTGNPTTNSACAPFPGWFGIGGTSLASPLWSGVIALWDSVHGQRFGNANRVLYQLFQSGFSYYWFFHDITGKNQTENNNGFYPTTPNYDMTTGIGTPRISGIVFYWFWHSGHP